MFIDNKTINETDQAYHISLVLIILSQSCHSTSRERQHASNVELIAIGDLSLEIGKPARL